MNKSTSIWITYLEQLKSFSCISYIIRMQGNFNELQRFLNVATKSPIWFHHLLQDGLITSCF